MACIGHIARCRECCAHAVGVACDIAAVDRSAVRVQRDGVGICFPLRPIFLVARFGVADCRNRRAGQIFVVIPAHERVACIGHIARCRKRCTHAVGVSGDIAAVDRAAVCVQRDGVGICFPLRPVFLIARFGVADCRNGRASQIFVVIPSLERISRIGHIVGCRKRCAHAVGVACDIAAVDRAAVRIQGYGVGRGCPLRRQFRHLSRNTVAGGVEFTVAAKPHKETSCIPVRAGQTVGRRRGKLAAGFHDDLNILGAITQLAAAKVKGNDLQSVRAQCVRVQDFKDGAETEERVGVRSIVVVPGAGRIVPANRTAQRGISILSPRIHFIPVLDISAVLVQHRVPFVALGHAALGIARTCRVTSHRRCAQGIVHAAAGIIFAENQTCSI